MAQLPQAPRGCNRLTAIAYRPPRAASGLSGMPGNAIQIVAPVLEIANSPVLSRLAQCAKTEVGEGDHFNVGRRICGNAIAGKGKITWRENTTLRVMNINIVNVG